MLRPVGAAAFAVLTLICTAPGQKHLELQDLVKKADVAFHGRVVAIANEELPAKNMAFTKVTFAVERLLLDRKKAGPVGKSVQLVFAGGRIGEKIVRVSGVPKFEVGQEVVAFAQHDGTRYASPILGGEQGLLRVLRDVAAEKGYPLLSGRRGIEAVRKGSFVPADRVRSIEDGQITWIEPEPIPGLQQVGAPQQVAKSGARSARVSTRLARRRPASLATLEDVFAGVKKLQAMLERAPVRAKEERR